MCISGTPIKYVIVDRLGALVSLTAPDSFDNNVLFDNTTPIYLINLFCKSG